MAVLGPFDFRGGYCPGYVFPALPYKNGYATMMENMKIVRGSASPRWGRVNVNSVNLGGAGAGGYVNGITSWNDTVNSKLAIVCTVNSKVYITDASSYQPYVGGVLTFTDRTGAVTIGTGALYTFDSLNNILILAGNSSTPVAPIKVTAYNANAAALGGSPPNADICKQVNNFMFLSRNLSSTTTQSKVYWSNVNDPETWTGTNVLDFNKNDGEPIMALGSIGTDLYIFKKNSIGRLSTVTITTSGAVTLGPLVTVIRGVGCCGPRALDNLPNGNIVFVSFNNHVYEFDGSSLVDISRQPYPNPNAFDMDTHGFYASSTHNFIGLSGCFADVNTNLKVCGGINEVWITYLQDQSGSNLYPQTFVYNYEQRTWQGTLLKALTDPDNRVVYSLSSFKVPVQTGLESSEIFLWGDKKGNVWVTSDFGNPFPADVINLGGSQRTTFSIGTTLQFSGEFSGFVPRAICFETAIPVQGVTAGIASLALYADFDTMIPTTSIYSTSTNPPTRVFANIPIKCDSGTGTLPTMISLLWTGNGPAIGSSVTSYDVLSLCKFWLSDEIMR